MAIMCMMSKLKHLQMDNDNYTIIVKDFYKFSNAACFILDSLVEVLDIAPDTFLFKNDRTLSEIILNDIYSKNNTAFNVETITTDMQFIYTVIFKMKNKPISFSFCSFNYEDDSLHLQRMEVQNDGSKTI